MTRDSPGTDPRRDVEHLFRAHARFVASFLARLGVAAADVDDVVQEVFTVAYRKGGFTPGAATARTWLGAIAMRVASSHRRAARRRREVLEDGSHGPIASAVESATASAATHAHAILEQREALSRVQSALGQLELGHRAVFVLFELEGESCSAIAGALELPLGTVYSRLHSARKKFLHAHAALLSAEAHELQPASVKASCPGDRP